MKTNKEQLLLIKFDESFTKISASLSTEKDDGSEEGNVLCRFQVLLGDNDDNISENIPSEMKSFLLDSLRIYLQGMIKLKNTVMQSSGTESSDDFSNYLRTIETSSKSLKNEVYGSKSKHNQKEIKMDSQKNEIPVLLLTLQAHAESIDAKPLYFLLGKQEMAEYKSLVEKSFTAGKTEVKRFVVPEGDVSWKFSFDQIPIFEINIPSAIKLVTSEIEIGDNK